MSARRRVPATLWWLIGLVGLAVGVATLGGATLYVQAQGQARRTAEGITGGDAQAGKVAISRYGCGGCHVIGGVAGAGGEAGPALTGVATRAHLAGALPNDPATMIRWLEHPQALRPGSGMPELGVAPTDARDMAAYLYTLK